MIQRREQLCFPSKTGEPIRITCEGFWQNFDGYVAWRRARGLLRERVQPV
jgi:hypothetical protein